MAFTVALPGLGTMRFGLRAKSVDDVTKVKAGLIKSRRITAPSSSPQRKSTYLYEI